MECSIIYTTTSGIISHAENTLSLFGYESAELLEKNILFLLSSSYQHQFPSQNADLNVKQQQNGETNGNHNNDNHNNDNKEKNNNSASEGEKDFFTLDKLDGKSIMQEGQHKNKEMEPFPIRLSISKIEEGMYMILIDAFKETALPVTMDTQGNIKDCGKPIEEMFGYDQDFVKSQNLTVLFPPEIQEKGQAPLLDPTQSDLIVRNLIGQHKSGSKFYCSLQLKATRIVNFVLYYGTLIKLDPNMEAIFILDDNETIQSYSGSYVLSLFGYKKDELLGQKMSSIIRRRRSNNPSARSKKRKNREEEPTNPPSSSAPPPSANDAATSTPTPTAKPTPTPAPTAAPQYQQDISGLLHIKHKDGSEVPIHLEMIPFKVNESYHFTMKLKRVALAEKAKEKKYEKYLGPWLLMEMLGEGTSGKVKRAKHRKTHEMAAIKIIQKRKLDKNELERTKREIEIMHKLNHENIIKLYDVIETDNKLNIVMELIDGEGTDLMTYIQRTNGVSEEESHTLFQQILAAIYYCHKDNIVHRDIKHKNIMVTKDKKIKLIDFGLSNFLSDGKLGATFCGTPAYAAPEMLLGQKYIGSLIDVWSLGVVFYTMLTGKFPFNSVSELLVGTYVEPTGVTRSCCDFLSKMLVVKPEERSHLPDIMAHQWITKNNSQALSNMIAPVSQVENGNEPSPLPQ
eukprot:TRINITY_DN759_c1_g1_i1.p1 TRINITY_DN759_c1_g1~~TRINITY_DN759_c1_g1_i1.p1  ORF type:complete len:682 (+),score=128.57 TRINITY_DN759_c1_g1_i1:235-2280(+)